MSRISKALEKAKKELLQSPREQQSKRIQKPGKAVGGHNADYSLNPENTLSGYRLNMATFDESLYKKNRIIISKSNPSATSAYDMLRTRVNRRLRSNNWHRVAISSASASDGKTLTAINLAISMARPGDRRIVLADFDLQRPKISEYLGLGNVEHCLKDYIEDRAKPEQVLYSTPVENLWIIPNRLRISNSSETLASNRIVDLLNWIQAADPQSTILLDLPPLLVSDDVLAVSPLFDALLLVLAEGITSRENARNTRELIEDHNIELIGTILNKSSDRMAKYNY